MKRSLENSKPSPTGCYTPETTSLTQLAVRAIAAPKGSDPSSASRHGSFNQNSVRLRASLGSAAAGNVQGVGVTSRYGSEYHTSGLLRAIYIIMDNGGLSNEDFRRIAATPRRVDVEDTPRKTSKFPKPSLPRPNKSRGNSKTTTPSLLPSGYRDRAQERRDLELAGDNAIAEKDGLTNIDVEALPEHLSKYLGGDADRSHLVKGLDYLLLQRSREAKLKEEELKLEQAMAEAADQSKLGNDVAVSESLRFNSEMARNIYNKCISQVSKRVNRQRSQLATFLPGRMVYEFDTDALSSASMPTILRRSHEDCGMTAPLVNTRLPDDTRSKLNEAMRFIRSGAKPLKYEPIPDSVIPPVEPPTAIPADDDDIFEGLDDYVCEPRAADSADVKKGRIMFEKEDEPQEVAQPAHVAKVDMNRVILLAKATAAQAGVSDKPELVAEEKSKAERLFDYDYDEYTAGAQMGYDSDDDVKRPVEAPSSGPTARKMNKIKSKEKSKLNTQWQQITTIIEKKKDAKRRSEQSDSAASKKARPT